MFIDLNFNGGVESFRSASIQQANLLLIYIKLLFKTEKCSKNQLLMFALKWLPVLKNTNLCVGE